MCVCVCVCVCVRVRVCVCVCVSQVYMGVLNTVNISGINDNPYDSLLLTATTQLLPGQAREGERGGGE